MALRVLLIPWGIDLEPRCKCTISHIVIWLFVLSLHCQWFDSDMPESTPFPGRYESLVTDFQRLMALRCFRVDRVHRAVMNFVTERMGEDYVTPPVVSFEGIFDQVSHQSHMAVTLVTAGYRTLWGKADPFEIHKILYGHYPVSNNFSLLVNNLYDCTVGLNILLVSFPFLATFMPSLHRTRQSFLS